MKKRSNQLLSKPVAYNSTQHMLSLMGDAGRQAYRQEDWLSN